MSRILLFLLIFSLDVFSQDVDLEKISSDISKLSNNINYNDIYHKSLNTLKVQENLGDFTTSFSIEIFKNLVNFDNIKFNYSSSNHKNIGFGTGWEIDLPRVLFQKSNVRNYEFIVVGFQYVDKLSATDIRYPDFHQRLQELNLELDYKVYIPRRVGNFNKYLRFKDSSWLIIKKDGSYLRLNDRGLVVTVSDSFNNKVKIDWEEDLPKRIFSNAGEALFEYEDTEGLSLVNYNYLVRKRTLKKINVRTNKDFSTYTFDIKSEYLQKVKKEGSELAILNVEYSDLVAKEVSAYDFEKNTNYVFDQSLSTPSLYKKTRNVQLYLDLEGDNYSDELNYRSEQYIGRVLNIFSDSVFNGELRSSTSLNDLVRNIEDIPLEKKIFLSEAGIKKEYQSNFKEKPFNIFVKEVKGHSGLKNMLHYSTNIMKMLDVDHDNVLELVVCSGGRELSDPLEGKVDRKNSIFEYFRTSMVDPSQYSLPARVYNIHKKDSFLDFELRKDVSFKCHSDSIFADINLDGNIDVINGSEIYFGDNSSNLFEKKSVQLENFLNINEYNSVREEQYIYSFDRVTNKLRFTEGHSQFRSPLENQSVYIYKEDIKYLKFDTNVKLLSRIKNSYGGVHDIAYDYKGKWVVSSIKVHSDSLEQTNSYNYLTPVLNELSGHFEGFSIVDIEQEKNKKYFKSSYQRLFFSNISDISSSYTLDKDGLYGYLRKMVVGSLDSVQYGKGERHIVENHWSFMNLNNDQVFIYKSKSIDSIIFDDSIVKNRFITNEYLFNDNNYLYESVQTSIEGGLLGLFSHLSESVISVTKQFSEDKSRLKTFVKKQIESDDFINIKKVTRSIYDVSLGYIVEKYSDDSLSESFYRDSYGRISNYIRNNTDHYRLDYAGYTNLITSVERNGDRTEFERDTISGQDLGLITAAGDKVEYRYDSSDRLSQVKVNDIEVVESKYININQVILKRANDIENIKLDSLGIIKAIEKVEPFFVSEVSYHNDSSGRAFLTLKDGEVISETYYDEFSRIIKKNDYLISVSKEYLYTIDGLLEYSNGHLVSTSDRNDNYLFGLENTFGNSVEMSYSLENRVRKVKGNTFDSSWSYNRENMVNLSNVKGEGVDFDFIKKFSANLSSFTLSDMTQGIHSTFIKNESGKISETKCLRSPCRGFYEVKNSYEDTLLSEENLKGEGFSRNISYEYEKSNLINTISKDYDLNFEYDIFGKISKTSIGDLSYESKEDYVGNVLSFKPYISSVKYNSHGQVSIISFNDNLKINYAYDGLSLIETSMIMSDHSYSLKVKKNEQNLITSIERSSRNGVSQNKYFYDSNSQYISKPIENNFQRNKKGQVTSIGENKYSYCYNLLCKVDKRSFHYSESEELRFVTKHSKILFEKINSNSYRVEDETIHSFKVSGKIVAISFDNRVYPVLSDHLGSVVAMFDTNGDLLWEREYSAHGLKRVTYTSGRKGKALESKTIFSFAGLIEVPGVSNLYWSKTRVYSPTIREWMTLDPAYIWNPSSLVNRRGDWNPLVYCNGDPVNFIDPTGYYSESYSLSAGDGSNDYDGATFNTQREADWATMATDQNQINSIMEQDRLISNIGMGVIGGAVLAAGAYAYGPALYGSAMTLAAQNPQGFESFVTNGIDLVDNLVGALGGMTTGTAPSTLGGYAGITLGISVREIQQKFE